MTEVKNELVIRLTGAVTESNFDAFKEIALAEIKAANKALVTDADFAGAEVTVKTCKAAEQAIFKAKNDALNQTADIRTLFSSLDELSGELAKTRLALEKQIKTEKERRKGEVVEKGKAQVRNKAVEYLATLPVISSVQFFANEAAIERSVSGKKTIEGMQKAVDLAVEFEIEMLTAAMDNAAANMAKILESEAEYPGLYPDKNTVAVKTPGEVTSEIEARGAKFKFNKLEKERRDSEKLKAEQEKQPESAPAKPAPPPPQKTVETVNTQTVNQVQQNNPYSLVIDLFCTRAQAIMFAENVVENIGNHPSVVGKPALKVREIA